MAAEDNYLEESRYATEENIAGSFGFSASFSAIIMTQLSQKMSQIYFSYTCKYGW